MLITVAFLRLVVLLTYIDVVGEEVGMLMFLDWSNEL